jgi:hypothetical protein
MAANNLLTGWRISPSPPVRRPGTPEGKPDLSRDLKLAHHLPDGGRFARHSHRIFEVLHIGLTAHIIPDVMMLCATGARDVRRPYRAEGCRDAIILGFSINLDLFAASLAFDVVDRHGTQYYPTAGDLSLCSSLVSARWARGRSGSKTASSRRVQPGCP